MLGRFDDVESGHEGTKKKLSKLQSQRCRNYEALGKFQIAGFYQITKCSILALGRSEQVVGHRLSSPYYDKHLWVQRLCRQHYWGEPWGSVRFPAPFSGGASRQCSSAEATGGLYRPKQVTEITVETACNADKAPTTWPGVREAMGWKTRRTGVIHALHRCRVRRVSL